MEGQIEDVNRNEYPEALKDCREQEIGRPSLAGPQI